MFLIEILGPRRRGRANRRSDFRPVVQTRRKGTGRRRQCQMMRRLNCRHHRACHPNMAAMGIAGSRRCCVRLVGVVNFKRVERLWRREGLKVPQKQPKRKRLSLNDGSCIRLRAEHPNHVWSYDFVEDRTRDGRKYRMLNIVDEFTRNARRNVPFVKFGGLKFLEASHIKDILALLRFVENPRDRAAGFRVMQLLQGVGPASAQRALDHMSEASDPIDALTDAPVPPRAKEDWRDFLSVVMDLRNGQSAWPADLERARSWYEPHLERIHEDASMRRADLIQLEQIASGYPSRERFLTELTLDPPDAISDQAGVPHLDEDYLILSTVHSSKGQEWKSVFLLNVVDGCIPSDLGVGTTAELEEERRLLYVAMTRAKDDLHLIVAQRFFTHGQNAQGDRHVYAARTRFIPNALLSLFEKRAWPVATVDTVSRAETRACAWMLVRGCEPCGDIQRQSMCTCIR